MFAVIKTGGKQYKVRVGETIDVEKLAVEDGAEVRLEDVLLAANDGAVAYGRPVIDGAVVTASVVESVHKGPKLIVFRYKSKSRYRRRTGHRQKLTRLTIQSIAVPGWETARLETPAEEAAEAAETAPQAEAVAPTAAGVLQGSAAPPDDVLPALHPTAQVDRVDGGAIEPAPGAAIEEPPQGLPGDTTSDAQ